MAAKKGRKRDSISKVIAEETLDSLEETLGLASENFDPIQLLYAPSLGIDENIILQCSVLMQSDQSEENCQEDSTPGDDGPDYCHAKSGSQTSSAAGNTADISQSRHRKQKTQAANTDVDRNTDDTAVKLVNCTDTESVLEHIETLESEIRSEQSVITETLGNEYKVKSKSATRTAAESGYLPDENVPECQTAGGAAGMLEEKPKTLKKGDLRRNVLNQMMNGFQRGPLSILTRSVQEKIKVRVWTRSSRSVRGISTGYVVAFDKHLNLAMIDVDEIYRKDFSSHRNRRKKEHIIPFAPRSKSTQISEEATEVGYPKTPWIQVSGQAGAHVIGTGSTLKSQEAMKFDDDDNSSDDDDDDDDDGSQTRNNIKHTPGDGIGNLSSLFSGMHVFDENEVTHLLGMKTRHLLSRHLNQVLLRGESVISVSLVGLDV